MRHETSHLLLQRLQTVQTRRHAGRSAAQDHRQRPHMAAAQLREPDGGGPPLPGTAALCAVQRLPLRRTRLGTLCRWPPPALPDHHPAAVPGAGCLRLPAQRQGGDQHGSVPQPHLPPAGVLARQPDGAALRPPGVRGLLPHGLLLHPAGGAGGSLPSPLGTLHDGHPLQTPLPRTPPLPHPCFQ